MSHLPQDYRPEGVRFRDFIPGQDLPYQFYHDIKAIDYKLYFVWHPFNVMYDMIMNQYTGSMDDPRFAIEEQYGQEVWGWVTTNGKGNPIKDETWHIWRLCDPYGWAHVCNIASASPEYLNLLVKRLYLQARIQAKEGDLAYNRHVREEEEAAQEKKQQEIQDLYAAVQDENSWLVEKAAENFRAGKTSPTRPTKDIISSYKGQTNKSRIVRPITDTEGGLLLPDRWKQDD
jgi:hypothetical protein